MREDIQKLLKLEAQINRDLSKIERARAKSQDDKLHEKEKLCLELLLSKTMDPANENQDIKVWKDEFKQIQRELQASINAHKEKCKTKKALYKDLKKMEKEEKKEAMLNIKKRFNKAKNKVFDDKINEMKDFNDNDDDIKDNKNNDVTGEELEDILNQISEQASLKSRLNNNEIIKDIGCRKLNNKFCLPIVNVFTNSNDLIKYLNISEEEEEKEKPKQQPYARCFELIRIVDSNNNGNNNNSNNNEINKCNLLLNNSNEWISKGEIWVNNSLRSKLRELFLSSKFGNEKCPIAIRKFYADTYFGGKYSLYGKNISQIKSICYRSIVESFRDEAIDKIAKKDKDFMHSSFRNYTVFDPFAGTGNWALQMSKLVESKNVFLWEIEKNIYETIIDNNNNNNNLYVFNHSFEIIPENVTNYVSNISLHCLILLSPPWGKAFKPGIGIDLTKGIFPIINLLKFYKLKLPNVKKVFAIQVDKNICNFGNILEYYDILLRNEHLLIIQEK